MGWFAETLALVRARYGAMLLASALAFLPANLLASGALRFGVGLFGGPGAEARAGDSSGKDLLISQKNSSPEQRARETPKTESAFDLRAMLIVAATVTVGLAVLLLGLALAHAALVPVVLGSARR